MISGSMVFGGLPSSLKKGFENIGWLVQGFDDQKIFTDQNGWATNRYGYRLFWRQLARAVQEQLISDVVQSKPALLLVLKGFYFAPETIARIRKLSPATVLMHFNPDNSFNTWHFGTSNDWIRKSIPLFDAHLTWGDFLIPSLRAAGAKEVFHLPFACDPELHHPAVLSKADLTEYGADVAFAGSWDEEREWWLSHLLDYRLKIWGNDWQKAAKTVQAKWQRKAMIGDGFSKVCCASKINLNFIRKQNIPGHNMRTFEIPACGGFMLCTRTSEQKAIWTEGEEIACFSSPQELTQMLDRYLADDQSRSVMASRANEKAYRRYSYTERARQIESEFLNCKLSAFRGRIKI
jgi:hypothetical protein